MISLNQHGRIKGKLEWPQSDKEEGTEEDTHLCPPFPCIIKLFGNLSVTDVIHQILDCFWQEHFNRQNVWPIINDCFKIQKQISFIHLLHYTAEENTVPSTPQFVSVSYSSCFRLRCHIKTYDKLKKITIYCKGSNQWFPDWGLSHSRCLQLCSFKCGPPNKIKKLSLRAPKRSIY